MTCATMLDQMLEADLPELGGIGDSAVAVHVRECARCRAVGEQLVRDTTALASVVTRNRSVGRGTLGVAAVGLAAAILFVVVRAWPLATSAAGRSPNVAVVGAVSAGASGPPAATGASVPRATLYASPRLRVRRQPPRRPAGSPQMAIVLASTAEPVHVDPVRAEPMTPAASVAPVRLDAPAADSPLGNQVRVDPPAGMRARVLRTTNPGVTVVWLSESPSTGPQP